MQLGYRWCQLDSMCHWHTSSTWLTQTKSNNNLQHLKHDENIIEQVLNLDEYRYSEEVHEDIT
jgi:hypothetical protein